MAEEAMSRFFHSKTFLITIAIGLGTIVTAIVAVISPPLAVPVAVLSAAPMLWGAWVQYRESEVVRELRLKVEQLMRKDLSATFSGRGRIYARLDVIQPHRSRWKRLLEIVQPFARRARSS